VAASDLNDPLLPTGRRSTAVLPAPCAPRLGGHEGPAVAIRRNHKRRAKLIAAMRWRERELLESLKRLAAPADEQVAYLRDLGSFPSLDELALEFDDVFGPPGTPPPEGPWADALSKLAAALNAMSGQENSHLWTADALNGPEWAEVRSLAREAIVSRPD
jgi:hypothetical protein